MKIAENTGTVLCSQPIELWKNFLTIILVLHVVVILVLHLVVKSEDLHIKNGSW